MLGLLARQHLDLGDHLHPRDAAAAAINRATERFERDFWAGERHRRLLRDARPRQTAERRGARRRHRRMAPLDRRQDGRPRRHPRAPRQPDERRRRRRARPARDRLNILATVGSVAPFVGLFGTVWGIMRSFTAIAGANNTILAVVAPGIAEALFATAHRPVRRDPGGDRLQPPDPRHRPARGAAQRFADRFHATLAASWRWRSDGALMGANLPSSARTAAAARRWRRSTSRRWSTSCWCC